MMAKQKRNMPSKLTIYNYHKSRGYKGKKYECMECGKDYGYVERCHIVPKCDKGNDLVDNLVLCCAFCHHLTDGRTKDDWDNKILGDGIGSLTIKGIRFPADYLSKHPNIIELMLNG